MLWDEMIWGLGLGHNQSYGLTQKTRHSEQESYPLLLLFDVRSWKFTRLDMSVAQAARLWAPSATDDYCIPPALMHRSPALQLQLSTIKCSGTTLRFQLRASILQTKKPDCPF